MTMGLVLRLCSLMQPGRAWRGGIDGELREVHAELTQRLEREGALGLLVDEDGTLRAGDERVRACDAHPHVLGGALYRSGIRKVRLLRGLDVRDLARFLSTVAMFGGKPMSDHHDLVTFWNEQDVPQVELVRTSLSTSYLGAGEGRALPELELLRGLLTGGGALPVRALAVTPALSSEPLARCAAAELGQVLAERLQDESASSLRRAALHSVMAALSAHRPALGESELARVLLSVLRAALRAGEFELVSGAVDHLERLADPAAPVRSRVHSITASVLERMRSVDWLVDLVRACVGVEGVERPDRLIAWLFERDPQTMLLATLSTLDPSQIGYAVAVFAVHFGTRDPFWTQSLAGAGLSQRNRRAVRRALASLEGALGLDDTCPPGGNPGARDTVPAMRAVAVDTRRLRVARPGSGDTAPGLHLADSADLLDDQRFIDDLDPSLIERIRERSGGMAPS